MGGNNCLEGGKFLHLLGGKVVFKAWEALDETNAREKTKQIAITSEIVKTVPNDFEYKKKKVFRAFKHIKTTV